MKFKQPHEWNEITYSPSQGPLLITGPCSAESENQVFETAKNLKEKGLVHIFRSGIWKPRTRPNSFEGVGHAGLPWLQRVKKELNLPVAIEVANSKHIDLALKYDIDIFWIGARTTVNPFQVQEIADGLKGLDIPILIKNPVNADLSLWIGAIERIYHSGIKKIAAIHRGFSTTNHSRYRNPPLWDIPIELKRLFPQLPIICDPSHITGSRELISHITQKAINLDLNGLMLEIHPEPEKALSDSKQQLTPEAFFELKKNLIRKSSTSSNPLFTEDIQTLRKQIDHLDEELIDYLAQRMRIVEEIAKCKIQNNITAFQVQRMNEMIKERIEKSVKKGLHPEYVNDLFHVIHNESVRVQTKIMKDFQEDKNESEILS